MFRIVVGDSNLGLSTEATSFILEVERIINHPEYDADRVNNDISIVVLKQSIDLTSHSNIKPACLPTLSSNLGGKIGTFS